jgi:hypothetical protein
MALSIQSTTGEGGLQLSTLGSGTFFINQMTPPLTNGGSIYFDISSSIKAHGTASQNRNAFNMSSGSFSVEFWYYPISSSVNSNATLFSIGNESSYTSELSLEITDFGIAVLEVNGTESFSTSSVLYKGYNEWYYIALQKEPSGNGSTISFFLDGYALGNPNWAITSSNYTIGGTTSSFTLGNTRLLSGQYGVKGFITNFQFINGTAIYKINQQFGQPNILVPTSPVDPYLTTQALFYAITGSETVPYFGDYSGKDRLLQTTNLKYTSSTPY